MSAKQKSWLIGLAMAAAGIVLARVVSRLYDQTLVKLAIWAVGTLLALGGLGFIMYGIKKSSEAGQK